MSTATELCDEITSAHREITRLSGGGIHTEANATLIEPLAATVRAGLRQLVQTPAATLAGWQAKAGIVLLMDGTDVSELAASLATDLLASAT